MSLKRNAEQMFLYVISIRTHDQTPFHPYRLTSRLSGGTITLFGDIQEELHIYIH